MTFDRHPGSRIIGTGHHRPQGVLTNADLEQLVETDDEWIRRRTGISTRHRVADGETVADLATEAGRRALADAGVEAGEVDLVVVATCTAEERSPSVAGRVSASLGMRIPAVFDLGAACSGFAHALAVADQSIRCGSARTALVVGAEEFTRWTDYTERTTCILTGDGAGAVVLRAAERAGVSPVAWGSVPEMVDAVRVGPRPEAFAQDGRAVFRWALEQAPQIAREVLRTAGVSMDEVDLLVPHQANLRLIEPLAEELGLREDAVLATDVTSSGNTSAASIPLALSRVRESGRVRPGARALLVGFGGGFAWAGQVVDLP
ncbi:beta-ketoacyl-ACP synthase III [Kytococcus sp. Marseille-QA3725]